MRQDFVANLSHELKTPLTSIKGFVETLLEGGLDDKENALHFLKIIQNHSNRLSGLIDDLLELSYLESRQVSLQIEKINLQALIYETILGFGSQTRKKNVEIINQIPAHTFINADKDKIQRIFVNLIDNALKFNKDNGKIIIACQNLTDGNLKISVEDSGCGIPEKDLTRVFERFYRVDKARSRELGGTGLGLSIVKHIAELHQGMIGVESKEGQGSKFWFTLPQ
jgi:two-component system phosphate regulon sensor histidine kinase PhoR